jgi:hypothetical protein
MIKKTHLLLAGAVLATACATPPRFEYGAYEPTLYSYYKKPEMADKFENALEKAIEKGEASGRLAPGLYSELGYIRLLQGDQGAAIAMFEKEAAAFPEANFFMATVVRRLKGKDMTVAEVPESDPRIEVVEVVEPAASESAQAGEPQATPESSEAKAAAEVEGGV